MGIINTIIRSRDDLIGPSQKSYWGYDLEISLVNTEEISQKDDLLPSEARTVAQELSGKEPVKRVIVLKNRNKELGRLTTSQLKEIFDDMGFNVDTIMSGTHLSDFNCVMNISGFIIPGWYYIAKFLSKIFRLSEKLLLTKLAPGIKRLHARIFEMNDGSWLITAHTDWNWMSLNFPRVFKAHLVTGTGDYEAGTEIMGKLLLSFAEYLKQGKIFPYSEIKRIISQTN
ncbi:MAG: hypothetical protein Q8N16_01245 [bacterium]|nr:hypothetical protein [bacterium]